MIPMKTLTLDGKTYEIVDEYARQALGNHAGPTDEQIREAIDTWLDENGDSIIPDVSGGNGKSAYEYAKEAGYTGTEEEFAQKLAEEALIAVTDDVTPAQVADAVINGRNVIITHIDGTYGSLCFNNFIYVPALGAVISSAIVYFAGDYLVIELVGSTRDGSWAALSKEVATVDDIPESLKNPYALTINGISYDGSEAVNIESIKGDTGQRGTGLLAVTTAPSGYTTAVGDITPKYRMSLSTIKTQAGVTEVLLGDTVRSSYYHYPIVYLDDSYAYFTTRISIRGATGAAGTDGKSAYAYAQDAGYTGTEEEFAQKLASDGSGATPDFEAAEGEPGHILNRTHYTERVITDIVPTKQIQLTDGLYTEAGLWDFVVGESYYVTFEGEQYECVAFESTFMGMNTVSIGNEAIYGGSNNTGEPFAAAKIPDMGGSGVIAPVEICTIGIAGVKDIVHPLDDKYINNEVKLTLYTGSCSKTWKEIVAALDAKKTLVAENRSWNSAFGATVQSLRLTYCTYGATSGILVFQGFDGYVTGHLEKTTAIAQVGYVVIAENGEITSVEYFESSFDPTKGLRNPYALTINGTSYDGSGEVDLTETVDNMIVAKLNALTHAEEVAF